MSTAGGRPDQPDSLSLGRSTPSMMVSIDAALRHIGVPQALSRSVPRLPSDAQAVLVYGSQARGDAVPGSDLDLLVLVPFSRPSLNAGDVSVSYYTPVQLETGVGSLFGAHLRRDSKVVWDPNAHIAPIVASMGDVDTERLFSRAARMSVLFSTPDRDLPKYLPGLLRHARYLLRSCLYAQAIASGRPCFSVREIADRHSDPELVELLASRQKVAPREEHLQECLRRLEKLLGEFAQNVHGSLEATIVNEWGRPSDLLSAAFLALGSTGHGSMYAEVEKILL
ncbi:hypothetical protein QE410_003142 [Microbacterium sp. SORGH_AS 1204]|uniref:nucleotidyltransferase domain-containing protein n=1 Tax=Microbacterium sp. SORGH_AS_1204 TaxID=3041785 RepID=UPI0027927745|nr:nucleotidyltransferase domain-containing protein [Microbacterium sp. SORGH_AS_1204]MDQ1138343.1 hypothetical protein [Microbacterium sp. SORGH_AS_1204]